MPLQFAHMKRHLGFDRLRLRGIDSANDEFLLVATAQNLRRLAKLCGQPPPQLGWSCQTSTCNAKAYRNKRSKYPVNP